MVPQILYLILVVVALCISARNHGKQKAGLYNFYIDLIAIAAQFGIMLWGGFFKPIFGF